MNVIFITSFICGLFLTSFHKPSLIRESLSTAKESDEYKRFTNSQKIVVDVIIILFTNITICIGLFTFGSLFGAICAFIHPWIVPMMFFYAMLSPWLKEKVFN